jgi:hypothetical protein
MQYHLDALKMWSKYKTGRDHLGGLGMAGLNHENVHWIELTQDRIITLMWYKFLIKCVLL